MKRECVGRVLLLVMLVGTLAVPDAGAQEEGLRLQQAWARLDEFVARHMKEENVPGLALAVTSRQGLLRVKTYGWADVKARVPVTPETLFEIGSISKSFTAICLLQLREEGKFDPQAPVTKYLPWFKINSKFGPILGHHLLSHSGGLPRDRDDITGSRYQAAALAERWTGFAPGERFYYSNIGYQTLGYLLEELRGQDYADIIRERIFTPLGMTSTEPVITHGTRKRLAVGYDRFYDDRPEHVSHPLVEARWLEYGGGDGSISATAADLAAYLRMLLNHGLPAQAGAGPSASGLRTSAQGRILSEESFRLLIGRVIPMNPEQEGEKTYYGYGLSIRKDDEGHEIISHGGGMVGYQSFLVGDLDAGVGAVAFINGPGSSARVANYALRLVRAALAGKELPALPESDDPTQVKNTADYAGTYVSSGGAGRTLTLVAEGEKLLLEHKGERIALERRGEDAFYVNHPDFALFPLHFGRKDKPFAEAQGKKVVEAWVGGDWYVSGAYEGPTKFEVPKEWAAYPGHYRTAHPWFSNFRVVVRKGKLWLVVPPGGQRELVPLEGGEFRVGEEAWSPERIRFDAVVGGQAQRATLSGCAYYRSHTP